MGLPYRTVLTLACLILGARYVLDSTASTVSRWIVGISVLVSLALSSGIEWDILGVLIQLAVSLFVILRVAANRT